MILSYFAPGRFEEQDELQQDDLRNRMKSSFSSYHPGAKQLAWQGIESILSPKQQRRHLPFLLYLSFFYSICLPLCPGYFSPGGGEYSPPNTADIAAHLLLPHVGRYLQQLRGHCKQRRQETINNVTTPSTVNRFVIYHPHTPQSLDARSVSTKRKVLSDFAD